MRLLSLPVYKIYATTSTSESDHANEPELGCLAKEKRILQRIEPKNEWAKHGLRNSTSMRHCMCLDPIYLGEF